VPGTDLGDTNKRFQNKLIPEEHRAPGRPENL